MTSCSSTLMSSSFHLVGGHGSYCSHSPHYFATLHASEQLFDVLMTWGLLGELQITNLSLKFFQQFDQNVNTETYKKGSEVYESSMCALSSWAERTLLFLSEHMPEDYVHLRLSIARLGCPWVTEALFTVLWRQLACMMPIMA
jgi:glycosyl hydrolase family 15